MKIIFWQNIISPHQSFLIRELSMRHEIILAVLEEISKERLLQGWSRPDIGKAQVVLLQDEQTAFQLYNSNKGAVQVFSGIASYPILKEVFKNLDPSTTAGVMVEAGSSLGWQKYLRKALYTLKYVRYNHKIDFIFAMGNLGVKWYQSVGFPKQKLHQFQYFTEVPETSAIQESAREGSAKLVFIGQLIDRKNIQGLVNALLNLENDDFQLDIIGDGPLREVLQQQIFQKELHRKIRFLGNLSNQAAMHHLAASDYLVLPSHFDGWGAVINEALSRGVKVITNENCGASCLVTEMNWGVVYKDNSKRNLQETLSSVLHDFRKEYLTSRKMMATYFAENYTNKAVEKFEAVLHTL